MLKFGLQSVLVFGWVGCLVLSGRWGCLCLWMCGGVFLGFWFRWIPLVWPCWALFELISYQFLKLDFFINIIWFFAFQKKKEIKRITLRGWEKKNLFSKANLTRWEKCEEIAWVRLGIRSHTARCCGTNIEEKLMEKRHEHT